ncbi:hypothetical protein PS1_036363 [Malus domestica]
MCDPCYNNSPSKKDCSSTSYNIIKLNVEYRWVVVRGLSDHDGFNVEMISSETRGEWRVFAWLRGQQRIRSCFPLNFTSHSAVAHNGRFYWEINDFAYTFELDPWGSFSSGDNIPKYLFIQEPDALCYGDNWILGESGGCLRMCKVTWSGDDQFSIWEFKLPEAPDKANKCIWSLHGVSLPSKDIDLISEQLSNRHLWVELLNFHPNNQDTMYFRFGEDVFMYHIGEGRLELSAKISFNFWRELPICAPVVANTSS